MIKNREGLYIDINTRLEDNNQGLISASDARLVTTNLADSAYLKSDGLKLQYNPEIIYFVNDTCIFNGGIYECIENTFGTFDISKWRRVNTGAAKFTDLTDAPFNYNNALGNYVLVSNTGSALEFRKHFGPKRTKFESDFFDGSGFAFSNSGTNAYAGLPTPSTTLYSAPAQGVAILTSGTTGPSGGASVRRSGLNGTSYPYYSTGAIFEFSCLIWFSVLPTDLERYNFYMSFHNTTGPFSDGRAGASISYNTTLGRAAITLTSATSSILRTEVISSFILSAQTWYKFTLRIDRSNQRYELLINDILTSTITTGNNIAEDYHGFIYGIQNVTNFVTSPTVLIDYHTEEILRHGNPVW